MKQNSMTMEIERDIEKSQMNVQEKEYKENYGKIIEQIPVEGTPFHKVKVEEGEVFISIGNARITELMSEEEADEMLCKKDWGIITSLITLVTERVVKAIQDEEKMK